MLPTTLTPGLLDAEIAYRRERLVADVASSRRLAAWVGRLGRLGRSPRTTPTELTLAA